MADLRQRPDCRDTRGGLHSGDLVTEQIWKGEGGNQGDTLDRES